MYVVVGVVAAAGGGAGLSSRPPLPTLSPTLHTPLLSKQLTKKQSKDQKRRLGRDQQAVAGIRGLMESSEHKVIGIGVVVAPPEERRPVCVECRTTATPMWRGGPTGPRSLCNACGIRYRKKRKQELGLVDKKQQPEQPPLQQQQAQQQQHLQRDPSEATSAVKDSHSSSTTKSSSLQVVKKRRVLMGVEEAAILLMALSSSSRSPALLHG